MIKQQQHTQRPKTEKNCLVMPTVLFGSREHEIGEGDKGVSNVSQGGMTDNGQVRFETLRWKYSGTLNNIQNQKTKTIINVASIPNSHRIFHGHRLIHNVHNPIPASQWEGRFCEGTVDDRLPAEDRVAASHQAFRQQGKLRSPLSSLLGWPLTLQHYLGSLERYMSRDDVRRTPLKHNQRGSGARTRQDDGWIAGWVASFVQEHGLQKVRQVLGHYELPVVAVQ